MSKKLAVSVILLALIMPIQGCSVFMAARQPGKKDISLFKVGTPRSLLIAEFGAPVTTDNIGGKTHEVFKFIQGYPAPARVGRALLHGAADIYTLCLWELIGTPTEMIFDGTQMSYEVTYDSSNFVDSVTLLKKEKIKRTKIDKALALPKKENNP